MTLSRSSVEPFLQFSARRDLREAAFRAWAARGESGGATDNRAIAAEMVRLRAERASSSATKPTPTIALPTRWRRPRARRSTCSNRSGRPAPRPRAGRPRRFRRSRRRRAATSKLAPWDWRYLAEKRRKAEFDFDESEIKPYLAARPHDRGGVLRRRPAVRPELRGALRPEALPSRRSRLDRDRAATARRSRSFSATISREPRSAAAPG